MRELAAPDVDGEPDHSEYIDRKDTETDESGDPDPADVGLFDTATDHTRRLDDVTDISPDCVEAHVTKAELFAVCPTCGGLRLRDETDEGPLPRGVPLRPDRILYPVCMGCYDRFQRLYCRDGYTEEEAVDAIDHGPHPAWTADNNGGDDS